MYALLDDNDQLVAGKPIEFYRKPKAITLNGVQYPPNWMQAYSPAEKEALHIWPLTTTPYDKTRYRETGADYTYSFDGTTITETIPLQDVTLDSYKSKKIKELISNRDAEANQDIILTFGVNDYTFGASEYERTLAGHVITANSAGMSYPVNFKWYTKAVNGDELQAQLLENVIEANFNQLASAMLEQEYVAQRKYWEYEKQVNEAVDHDAVDAIIWA